jgi:hypothetical protein
VLLDRTNPRRSQPASIVSTLLLMNIRNTDITPLPAGKEYRITRIFPLEWRQIVTRPGWYGTHSDNHQAMVIAAKLPDKAAEWTEKSRQGMSDCARVSCSRYSNARPEYNKV